MEYRNICNMHGSVSMMTAHDDKCADSMVETSTYGIRECYFADKNKPNSFVFAIRKVKTRGHICCNDFASPPLCAFPSDAGFTMDRMRATYKT